MSESHTPRFIHLRLHTEYSISDGIVQVDSAIARAAADGMPALGISDLAHTTFFKRIEPLVSVWVACCTAARAISR